ncbi:MAG: beta-ketoacyl-[acyl-carrier-protein] synthase family protein [Candidatus Brocadiia bacterium]
MDDLAASSDHDSLSRTAALALEAGQQALAKAGNPEDAEDVTIGVCMGSTVAVQLNDMEFYQSYRASGRPPMEPVHSFLEGNLSSVVADVLRCDGPRSTVVNACSSGADAIGMAVEWLRAGLCDAVLAGGADELSRVPLSGFYSLGIMSDSPCRPFDARRDGLNLGEGAGVLVLESARSARSRGLEPELVLAGYGCAADAHHLTAPHPEGRGLRKAITVALEEAGVVAEDISFVNAHGTATPDNDRIEGEVLADIFGSRLLYLSTKGYTGHTLGAAGGLEAAFTALALREGWLPKNRGSETPDPQIPLAPLSTKTDIGPGRKAAVSTSLAFGGNNAALVITTTGAARSEQRS